MTSTFKLFNKLKKLKPVIKIMPVAMIVFLTGVSDAEAIQLAEAGDLDAAIASLTGMDMLTDGARAAGDAVHKNFKKQLDQKGKSRDAMEKQLREIEGQ